MALIALLGTAALHCNAQQGIGAEEALGDEQLLLQYPVIARITVVGATAVNGRTNGRPGHITVQFEEVIAGNNLPTDPKLLAIWRPMPLNPDYFGADAKQRLAKWLNTPNPAPRVGSSWIIAGEFADGVLMIAPRCRYPFTKEKLAWVKLTREEGLRRVRLEREAAERELAQARAADLAVQRKADIRKLLAAATDVAIGERSSEGFSPDHYGLTVHITRRIKDSRQQKKAEEQYLDIDIGKDGRKMVSTRLALNRPDLPRFLLFLKVLPGTITNQHLSNADHRLYDFVDGQNGMLVADEVLGQLLEELAKDARK